VRNKLRLGLAAKLALSLVGSTALILFVFSYINRQLQQRAIEELVLASAERMSDIIFRSTSYQMLHNDREALYQTIRNIGNEQGIRRVRIFNKDGRIQFSTDPTEVGRIVDKQGEACYGCHSASAPLEKLKRPDRSRIFHDEDRTRVLAVIRPIENQPACSNASCHAHSEDRRILGVIDTHLTLATVDAELAAHQNQLRMFSLGAMAVMCVVSVLFVWLVLHGRLRALMAGTNRLADGDLDYRLPVNSKDELGELAASFNKMTGQLAVARAEIEAWAKTLEQRVEKKTKELERTQSYLIGSEKLASLGKLAATVAHEVNNPLAGILTYARLNLKEVEKLPLDDVPKQRLTDHLKIIERESRRCREIMKNLLTFARQTPSNLSPNQVNELVERAVRLVRHQLDMQEVEVEVDLKDGLPKVDCDPGQIQQVVLVLLVNAGEAMTQGGKLLVSTEHNEDDQSISIRVKDDGPGIPEDVLARIFEPFFTTKEDQHRTGLGLAVARSIVDQHAGSIQVNSRPGEGTELVVTLPVRLAAAALKGRVRS